MTESNPPPAQGVRLDWASLPEHVRAAVEQWLGSPVIKAVSQPTGFSPGVAAHLTAAAGRQVFVKAISPVPNADAPRFHRREIRIASALPAAVPAPRLLWSYDEGSDGWVVLVFEHVVGHHPAEPWREAELNSVMAAMVQMADALTPSPLPVAEVGTAGQSISKHLSGWRVLQDQRPDLIAGLDPHTADHLDKLADLESAAPEASAGDTLLHFDLRADNMLLAGDKVWFVDWPHARIGAAWVDVVAFAPSVTMQGGPPPEQVLAKHPASHTADPAAITAVIAALAGFFTYQSLLPPPPGLPTLRAFQAAQGKVAYDWVVTRTHWS